MAANPSSLSPQEYLASERSSAKKHEYFQEQIRALGGASRKHVIINSNLTGELTQKLRAREYVVYANDLRVLVSSNGLYTYPDIVVTCSTEQFTDDSFDTLLNPLLLIEITHQSEHCERPRLKIEIGVETRV